MKTYNVTLQIDAMIDCEVRADSLESALEKARQLNPSDAIKVKSQKKNSVVDWEVKDVTSVFEA